MGNARAERWWWLGAFLVLSVLIHVLLALHGPGFGLKGAAPSPKEIELTLEALPPKEKPPAPKPKVAARPKPLPKVIPPPPKVAKVLPKVEKRPVPKAVPKPTPKVAVKPLEEKPVVRAVSQPVPAVRVARVTPAVAPAAVRPARTVTPEALPEQAEPVKMASVTPHVSHSSTLLDRTNPLASLATPDDTPETAPSARADTPNLTRSASARSGTAGGASGGGRSAARAPQTPTDQPQDSGLAGGRHFPRMATRLGGESILSVKNPLAEDAVPEEKPGFSAGAGGGPGLGRGSGRGGLDGKLMASLRGGHGPGLGGGSGGGVGAGSGRGSGRGRGAGHGTGAGVSGDGSGADGPGGGDGYGRRGVGFGAGGGRRVAGGGAAFGGVGGLLRGEPTRAPGDGRPGTDGHGLSAEIYEGLPYLGTLVHRRTDAVIDFDWGTTAAVVQGVSRIFSIRWTGSIQANSTDTYTFESSEDDGLRVWIGGQPVISDWVHHKTVARRGTIRLEAGRKYPVRIEYFENGIGGAEVHLRWSSPSRPEEVVPESAWWQTP